MVFTSVNTAYVGYVRPS